jgi:plasmid stabilization system protein ParE
MTFRVELSEEASRDADDILEWLYERQAGRTGINWFLAMEDAIASLENMPARCPVAPESARYPYEVRELRYGRRPHVYRILFSISGAVVQIKHIRHARRQGLAD